MKITVLYNVVKSPPSARDKDILADDDTVKTALDVSRSLQELGHAVDLFEVDEKTVGKLAKINTDFFFNLAEGIGSQPNTEHLVIEELEKADVPFSGSGSKAIKLTTDKIATKKLLLKNKLPTPKFSINELEKLRFPVIVKPANRDGSLGISAESVCTDEKQATLSGNKLKKKYGGDVLFEEFIDGRELNVAVIGDTVLPISEIVFGPSFGGKPKIVDFAAKWEEETVAYRETIGVCPADLLPEIEEKIKQLAVAAIKVTGVRNYARVDFRLDQLNRPFILEVNANPGLAPDSGVIRSAVAGGFSYGKFLQFLIKSGCGSYNQAKSVKTG